MCIALIAYAADEKQDEVPRFDINRFQVEGNTLLDKARVDKLLAPFTGKGKDFGTVQEAIEALEQAYRDRGFSMVAVTLPEQGIEHGVVVLRVIESRIGKIDIVGNHFFDQTNIRNSLPGLQQGITPNLNTVSKTLKLANENPAKKINLQLLNTDKENVTDAHIEVKDERPWKIGLSADNTGTKDTGVMRAGILLQHANVFNRDQLLTLQYITAPEKWGTGQGYKDVGIYSLGYHMPFYSLGSSLDAIGAYSTTDSGTVNTGVGSMGVSGKGSILGLHYNQNLTRIGDYEHKLTLALDYRAYENSVTLLGIQLGNNVTVHPVSLTYSGTITIDKVNVGFYLTDIQNIPGNWDGRDDESDFNNSRAGAPRSYNVIKYGANVSYAFPGDWQARALVNGQYTNDPLVPGEQFGIGGASSVRGFHEREIAKDQGYSGSVEIYTPDLSKLVNVTSFQSRFLVFYDRGYVSLRNPAPGDIVSTQIDSIGPGLRITDGKKFSFSADYGLVVNPPDETTTEKTTRWSGLLHVSASILF
jgi:hemolysin activation/secretion protein